MKKINSYRRRKLRKIFALVERKKLQKKLNRPAYLAFTKERNLPNNWKWMTENIWPEYWW